MRIVAYYNVLVARGLEWDYINYYSVSWSAFNFYREKLLYSSHNCRCLSILKNNVNILV